MIPLILVTAMAAEDPRLWLEDVEGEQALEWVRAQNDETVQNLATTESFAAAKDRLLQIYDSNDRIPGVSERGGYLYNFWRDAEHPRGLWRRTTLASYREDAPEWDVLIDIDKLAEEEGENWVYAGVGCLPPEHTMCLVELSRGGADATVTREFDLNSRTFVEGGFALPEAKGGLRWIDADTVYVSTDFGEGTMTDSGYPRVVKRWSRGTDLSEAEVVYEGNAVDISVGAWHDHEPGYERDFAYQGLTFYTNKLFEVTSKGLWEVPKQDSANANVHKQWMFVELREDWTVGEQTYPQGSLLVADYKKVKKGKAVWTALFTPSETTSLQGYSFTRDHLVMTVVEDVVNRIEILTPGKKGEWTRSAVEGLPEGAQVSAWPVNADEGNDLWFSVDGYLTPDSLWRGTVGGTPEKLKQTPSWFDESRFEVSQHFATSKDGTRVPYFQIAPKDAEGTLPTLLYGYGGFEVSLLPGYNGTMGAGWLERGGVYVVANIRGGGEYGPRWHQAALKENRHRAYEDFAAVAEDLVARGVTTHATLGAMGGSNGGLLMGNMYTLYPGHWGGIVCQVPLLDMKRYTKLLAGASWAGEYGDPDDPEQWSFIQTFSPYHNIDAAAAYPPILFTTSTRDDRVHPGHARKMAHALVEAGKDVSYYENIEGGHGGSANNEQAAFMRALAYEFLWQRLTAAPAAETPEEAPAE